MKLVSIYTFINLIDLLYHIYLIYASKSTENKNENEINSNQVEVLFTNVEYVNNIDKPANSENSKSINLILFISCIKLYFSI